MPINKVLQLCAVCFLCFLLCLGIFLEKISIRMKSMFFQEELYGGEQVRTRCAGVQVRRIETINCNINILHFMRSLLLVMFQNSKCSSNYSTCELSFKDVNIKHYSVLCEWLAPSELPSIQTCQKGSPVMHFIRLQALRTRSCVLRIFSYS